jgi:MFS family permease
VEQTRLLVTPQKRRAAGGGYDDERVDWLMTALLFLFPAVGGALFGYDIGATSGALVSMTSQQYSGTDWYSLSAFQSGLVVSLSLAGALLGSGGLLLWCCCVAACSSGSPCVCAAAAAAVASSGCRLPDHWHAALLPLGRALERIHPPPVSVRAQALRCCTATSWGGGASCWRPLSCMVKMGGEAGSCCARCRALWMQLLLRGPCSSRCASVKHRGQPAEVSHRRAPAAGAGSLVVALAPGLPTVMAGRLLYGVGIGFAMHAAPAYIAGGRHS